MNDQLYYLNENDSLSEALHAFFVTNHHVFIVISDNQQYLGIVTIEAMLKELLGHIPGDEFDSYNNKERVANRYNLKLNDEATVQTDEEVLE
jgi:Mg2+/Co2+ transporter CorB